LTEVATGAGAVVPWPPFVVPTLGVKGLTVTGLLERLARELALPRANPSIGAAGRVLDTGIEAQVHGPIDVNRDVERLVADPSFVGTAAGDNMNKLAQKCSFPLDWHGGFWLPIADIPDDFRGPAIPRLAKRIASNGKVDAATLGAAQQSLILQPEDWQGWGDPAEILQQLKQLWHVLVHYGQRPVAAK
jgi:hypothetical protein